MRADCSDRELLELLGQMRPVICLRVSVFWSRILGFLDVTGLLLGLRPDMLDLVKWDPLVFRRSDVIIGGHHGVLYFSRAI